MRLDKWLWQTRFFRTRGLASDEVTAGHVRVNGVKVSKPGRAIGRDDTLTFPQGDRIRVVRVSGLPARRGPAPEARSCYLDLDPSATPGDLE